MSAPQTSHAFGVSQIRFPGPTDVSPRAPFAYWFVLVFLLLLYANTPLLLPALEQLRPAQLIAAGALGALLLESMFGSRSLDFAWPDGLFLLAFVGAAGLSCLSALWPKYAVAALSDLAKMALIYLLIVNSAVTRPAFRGLIWTLLIGGMFPALGTINNYLHGILIEGRGAWIGIFANPNEAAYALVILLPLAAYLAIESGWFARLALAGIAALYLGAIFLTFSRGGLVGLAAVVAVYSWRKKSVWLYAMLAVGLAGAIVVAAPHWTRSADFEGLNRDLTFQQRIATSKAGLDMFLDHPLTGVGLNCSVVAWPLYAPPGVYSRSALITHNTVIQVLSETGLLGFIPFALFVGLGIAHARKLALAPETARIGAGVEASLWGLLACGMSGGYVLTWFPYILLGVAGAARRLTPAPLEAE